MIAVMHQAASRLPSTPNLIGILKYVLVIIFATAEDDSLQLADCAVRVLLNDT